MGIGARTYGARLRLNCPENEVCDEDLVWRRPPCGSRAGLRARRLMRAMVVTAPDGPDALRLEELAAPDGAHPKARGERLLIEVHATGVSFPDLLQSRGEYQISVPPPFVSGGEVAGVVREAPAGSLFAVGDRVAGLTLWGG